MLNFLEYNRRLCKTSTSLSLLLIVSRVTFRGWSLGDLSLSEVLNVPSEVRRSKLELKELKASFSGTDAAVQPRR